MAGKPKKKTTSQSASAGNEKSKSFEENLTELETIVEDLEQGELPLEKSIEKYQDGITRLKQCYTILEQAQKKVDVLTKDAKTKLSAQPSDNDEEETENGNPGLF